MGNLRALRITAIALLSLVVSATLAGCGSTAASSGAVTIKVTLTPAGCSPKAITAAAGPTTFSVTNDGASAISEFEILDGATLVGEVENVPPSFTKTFSLTLQTGNYVTYCPGGTTDEHGSLSVTGSTSATPIPQSTSAQQAVTSYRAYLEQQTARLVATTVPFADAVKAGDIAKAKQLYVLARPYYEAVEPVAETFGDLDPRIDNRIDNVVKGAQWTGFHRIEKALWVDNSLAGMIPIAKQLVGDVTTLQTLVKTVKLEPATIANGAVDLLDEVSSSKITGEEERYSHIDLVDFQANVDGAQQAFFAVRPLLSAKDAQLASEITQRFEDVDAALAHYKVNGTFELYTQLKPSDTKALSAVVDALAEPLSSVAAQIVA